MPSGIPFGDYFLQRRLGAGGMAEVFLAKRIGPEGFEKQLVIKRILPHLSSSEELTAMFLDEARLAARIDHPNLAHVSDFGRVDDRYYLAMEYVDGLTVADVLATSVRLSLDVACRVALDVLEALHAVHTARGDEGPLHLVHRDVSPSNVMISRDGAVKLLDLGIAIGGTEASASAPVGTRHYMSPEQLNGEAVDARADIYAVGVLLHRMVTGERPTEPAGPCPEQIPEALWLLIHRAMAADPEERPASARELSYELEQVVAVGAGTRAQLSHLVGSLLPARDGGALAKLSRRLTAMVTALGTQPTGAAEPRGLARSPSRARMLVLATLLVGLAGGAGYALLASARETSSRTPVPGSQSRHESGAGSPSRSGSESDSAADSSSGSESDLAADSSSGSESDSAADSGPDSDSGSESGSAAESEPNVRPGLAHKKPRRAQRNKAKGKTRPAKPTVVEPAPVGDGFLTIDTRPWTEVYFQGRKLGLTPMERVPLPPGSHDLRLKNPKLGLDRVVRVVITAGEVTISKLRL